MHITFLGATGTVTGSKYLLVVEGKKILIDCGLFQGFKQLRLRNWAPLPIQPHEIDAVILTHAHLDHSGYLPLLIKNGFRGPVYSTFATRDLCAILLPDSGYLQEEAARYANKKGFSKHETALPLYTSEDGKNALSRFVSVPFNEEVRLFGRTTFTFLQAGHLLGSALIRLSDGKTTIGFTGDLGRPNDPIMRPPAELGKIDYLVCESTYGNRLHEKDDPLDVLAAIISKTVERGGVVLIPSFAVGRAQSILYFIHQLKQKSAIPDVPVYLNSPMAVNATEIFVKYHEEHRLTEQQSQETCTAATFVHTADESQELNTLKKPMVIISASGMATGGRILHHLLTFAPDPRNTLLFAGFQAGGTRGEAMVNGAPSIKIHGSYVPVNAEVKVLHNLSAHADYNEIIGWLKKFKTPPKRTFITHGEPAAANALRLHIEEELKWKVYVPEYKEGLDLV